MHQQKNSLAAKSPRNLMHLCLQGRVSTVSYGCYDFAMTFLWPAKVKILIWIHDLTKITSNFAWSSHVVCASADSGSSYSRSQHRLQ